MPKKPTKQIGIRKYRYNKTNPKRLRVDIIEDLGEIERKTSLFIPKAEIKDQIRERNPNPNRLVIINYPVQIVYYKDTGKLFCYDCDGNFCGTLTKKDLKNAFTQIGLFLKAVKGQKSYIYNNIE